MKKFAKLFLVAGSLAIASAGAFAEGDVVKERQGLMKTIGGSMGVTVKMIRGATPFDAAAAEEALKKMSEAAGKFPELFKEGTDMSKVPTSEASPKIWENMEDFKKKAEELKVAALKGSEAAKGGLDSLKGSFKAIAATCSGCHQAYRVKKQ
ncbi:MAG: c-type cytochrome [Methyloligellaceae bacterium]